MLSQAPYNKIRRLSGIEAYVDLAESVGSIAVDATANDRLQTAAVNATAHKQHLHGVGATLGQSEIVVLATSVGGVADNSSTPVCHRLYQ